MEDRVRLLEDALAIAQAQESDQPHPLLVEPFKLDADDTAPMQVASPGPNVEDLVGTLGTLHINEKEKTMRFFGPTGGAEVSDYLLARNYGIVTNMTRVYSL